MEYIVSARKYRPMTFDAVVGQSALTTTLKNAVKSGKLAHAYLFCGPRGVGKTTCARIFAKVINCEHPDENGEACNHCESCKAFNEQRSYNIFELDAASNNSVENIKVLMEQTRIPPQVGKYKVFIIDEVHMLSTQAFNAFLKTLEEPPAHVIFILATTEKHKILPTIISRCQIYDFERMSVPDMINYLKMVAQKENIQYEEEALNVIAEKADGGMRDALSIFDQTASFCQGNITYQKVIEDLNVLDSENYFHIINLSLENKVADVMVLLNNIIAKGFDGGHLINGLAVHVRNVLMAKDTSTLPLLEVSQQQAKKFQQQAVKCPVKFLYQALKIMNDCDINYRQSSNKRLLVELTLIRIAQITQEDDEPVAGRSPKRLKSLFKHLHNNIQTKGAQQVASSGTVQQPIPSTTIEATGQRQHVAVPQTLIEKHPSSHIPSKAIPWCSFDSMLKEKPNPNKPAEINDGNSTENKGQQQGKTFNEDDLRQQWFSLCNRMPSSMTGLSARMRNLDPQIKDYPNIEVVVDNENLRKMLNDILGKIRATLRQLLSNNQINVTLRLAETHEMKKVLNRKEQLEEMRKDNPAIEKLCAMLGLELT